MHVCDMKKVTVLLSFYRLWPFSADFWVRSQALDRPWCKWRPLIRKPTCAAVIDKVLLSAQELPNKYSQAKSGAV